MSQGGQPSPGRTSVPSQCWQQCEWQLLAPAWLLQMFVGDPGVPGSILSGQSGGTCREMSPQTDPQVWFAQQRCDGGGLWATGFGQTGTGQMAAVGGWIGVGDISQEGLRWDRSCPLALGEAAQPPASLLGQFSTNEPSFQLPPPE